MPRTLDPFAPRHALISGATSVLAQANGDFDGDREGLFDRDCRMLSRHVLLIDGARVDHARTTTLAPQRAISRGVVGWHAESISAFGPRLPEDCLEVAVIRAIGRGLVERIVVHNHSMVARDVRIELLLDADFRDALAITREVSMHPEVTRVVTLEKALVIAARFTHRGHLLRRTTMARIRDIDARPTADGFTIDAGIAARGALTFLVEVACAADDEVRSPYILDPEARSPDDDALEQWRARRATIASTDALLDEAFANAADDLFALRLEGSTVEGFVPQAGAPSYTGLYGRDALTAAWQGAMLGPEMLLATVPTLAGYVGKRDDAFHDEEPGRLIHEVRQGPLAELGIFPQSAYFGTVTTPAMFVVTLSEAWHWTGDRKFVEAHQDVALQALQWARTRGDRDGDGLIEYETRSARGLRNQGWKDSDEAIRHSDGTIAKTPIATVEEQAYHLIALERMAEMRLFLDDDDGAKKLLDEARILRERIDQRFWQEDLDYYALALDCDKRAVRSIASNAGHVLAAGAAKSSRARAVADRLLSPELFNGWGVRTLSSEHPSYNPLGYHLGAVWPVECATFILGFRRYGLDEHALTLATALLDASATFVGGRLPEVFGGQPRSALCSEPCLYPSACWPQAWSASSMVLTLQSLLGIYAFAPARLLLIVHPLLPRGVDDLVVDRLRVGDAEVSLHFWRTASNEVKHEVIGRHGDLVVVTAPPPVDVDGRPSWKRWLLHHAPGKTAQILRLAIGDVS